MLKKVVLTRESQIEDFRERLRASAEETQLRMAALAGSAEPMEFLYRLKFERLGCHPLDSSRELNFVEQLHQTFTYLASFTGAEFLFERHPAIERLKLNLGTDAGWDLEQPTTTALWRRCLLPSRRETIANWRTTSRGSRAPRPSIDPFSSSVQLMKPEPIDAVLLPKVLPFGRSVWIFEPHDRVPGESPNLTRFSRHFHLTRAFDCFRSHKQVESDDVHQRRRYLMADSNVFRSPRITHLSWGRMEVEGLGRGKDFKLYPGGGREWDWSETGTRHVPGIQPADVFELLENGSEVVVLTRGMELVLRTCPETLAFLRDRQIPVHVEETRAAVALYNKLAEEAQVGGLFHSTC